METLEDAGCIGVAEYIDCQESWVSPEWEASNQKFFTVVVDNVLEFLWDYYMPL